MIPEIPPQLQGSPEQQLIAMRDYLVRLAQSLDSAGSSDVIISRATKAANSAASKAHEDAVREVKEKAASLKALIIKTADEITEYTDSKVEEYNALYVAKSDFGTYTETVQTQFETTARGVVESYNYGAAIQGAQNTADAATAFITDLNGQIRRGAIEDPETHEVHLGIAISESLSFTGQTLTDGGLTYYELTPGQTLGLYTATGWQFWINGVKRGWFSSEDSMLHVSNIVVENKLQLGADWEITTSGGFGLRYIGG